MAWLFELLLQFIVEMIADAFSSSLSKRERVGCLLIAAALLVGLVILLWLR